MAGDTLLIENTWERKLKPSMKIIVIGAGKASAQMALAIENILGNKISAGQINIPEKSITLPKPEIIKLHFAGHPFVSKESIDGTKKIISLIKNLNENDLVICLISGGGSALLELPYNTITLADLGKVFTLLTKKGATIHELNTIRKHLSQVKGGKLAQIAYPAQVISLIISDVIGDNLDTIASGPTAPDKTTIYDVRKIIKKYKIKNLLPLSVKKMFYLRENWKGVEILKDTKPIFQNVKNYIIASNKISCTKMKEFTDRLGFKGEIFSTNIYGEARNIGRKIAEEIMRYSEKIVLISGGETTVTIKGSGIGGRNQELALAASGILKNLDNVVLASIGSDGIDGPTDAAGALIDGYTIKKGQENSLNQLDYLKNNDSYNYLKKTGNLIYTGLTGTNVGDFIIAIKDI
ncbi:MAG: DUF4147 domain-containing protein [Asgard group archaeon]|nr:DUF4147 domain-containing protein [Asgard group archaeon]